MRFKAWAVFVSIFVALAWAVPAYAASAIYYGSAASPLKAEGNSDDGNAWFYGAVAIIDQTWMRNRYWFRDSAPGGNKAYVTTDWSFWRECTGGSHCFKDDESDRSSEDRSGNWLVEMDYVDLHPSSDRGRARTRVCENQNNAPDDCSKYATATLGY